MTLLRERLGDVSRGATERLLAQPRTTSCRLRHLVMPPILPAFDGSHNTRHHPTQRELGPLRLGFMPGR